MYSSTQRLLNRAVVTVITSFVSYLRRKCIMSSKHMPKAKITPIHANGLQIPTKTVLFFFCNGSCCPLQRAISCTHVN